MQTRPNTNVKSPKYPNMFFHGYHSLRTLRELTLLQNNVGPEGQKWLDAVKVLLGRRVVLGRHVQLDRFRVYSATPFFVDLDSRIGNGSTGLSRILSKDSLGS